LAYYEVTASKELPPNNDMKYKLRLITVHEGQGGGFQGKKKEQRTKKHPKLIILDTFVILQHRNSKMLREWR